MGLLDDAKKLGWAAMPGTAGKPPPSPAKPVSLEDLAVEMRDAAQLAASTAAWTGRQAGRVVDAKRQRDGVEALAVLFILFLALKDRR